MTQLFADKTAIVTGAGSGIGRATALILAARGARVIATDLSAPRLADLTKTAPGITTITGDVADRALPAQLVDMAGTVDILINNAGIMDAFLPAHEVDDATWEKVLDVNLTAPLRLIRAVLPGMMAKGAGAIVNVGSEAGLRGSAAGAAYTASKAALHGLTLHVAVAYGPMGIRCNAVAPGATKTNIVAPFKSDMLAARLGPMMQTNIPRMAEPDELAEAICFLASPAASNINGIIMPVDGGWSAI